VSHRKSLTGQIPADREALWQEVVASSDVVALTNLGDWNVGSMRREAQARVGGVLIALGGDEGVLHLANLYHESGKPVFPLDLQIGHPEKGAALLRRLAERDPGRFFRVVGHDPSALLVAASLAGYPPVTEAVAAALRLLEALAPPTAFCVRLMNPEHPDFATVDRYFRHVVDPVIREAGYEPLTIDPTQVEGSFLNVEIFTRLHRSQLVLADYTGHRPNCFIEMGYALGRETPVVSLARLGTDAPFDIKAVPTLSWDPDADEGALRNALRDHWVAAVKRAAIVPPDPFA
jgi:hypothetical protein